MKIRSIIFLLFAAHVLAAQTPVEARFRWGVLAGFESQRIDWRAAVLPPGKPLAAWVEGPGAGGQIGFFASRRLGKSVALRSELTLGYNRNSLWFRREDETYFQRRYQFADLDLPLHVVFKNRKGNFPLRGVVFAGGHFSYNFLKNQPVDGLFLYQHRVAADLGMGIEIRVKKLHFQPEVLYSYGLNNLNDATETPEILGIGKTVRDRLVVRLLAYF